MMPSAIRLPAILATLLFAFATTPAARAQDDGSGEAPDSSAAAQRARALEHFQARVPGAGVRLYQGADAQLDFSLYASIRYLNQHGLASSYTNSVGTTTSLDRREDLQFQKVLLYFKGWLGVPELRYLTYVWTSNASQGLGAQVVVAGNLSYRFSDRFNLGAGIGALPTARTTRGNFPFWLSQDSRTIADDYFRGSYTSGMWAWGDLYHGLHYRAMVGNNLSQLGIDAGQLDMGMQTFSGSLWWTTPNYSPYEGLGDFRSHEQLAASVGGSLTQSRESKQSQSGTEDPENSQIRISDGRLIFTDQVFATGAQINNALYQMTALDGSLKYRGVSLEGEYFRRWLGAFEATGPLPMSHLTDDGFQVQISGMVVPSRLQLYASASKIFGDFGNPFATGFGLNYFPFQNQVLRVNGEMIVADRSPVGNLSAPLIVGADGTVFVVNVEVFF